MNKIGKPGPFTYLPLVRDFVTSFEIVESKFRQSYANILESPNAIVLVADDGGTLIGYCLGFSHVFQKDPMKIDPMTSQASGRLRRR